MTAEYSHVGLRNGKVKFRSVMEVYMRGFCEESKEQICGTCEYHQHEKLTQGWVCVNSGSIYCTEWTDYNDRCEMWEERK